MKRRYNNSWILCVRLRKLFVASYFFFLYHVVCICLPPILCLFVCLFIILAEYFALKCGESAEKAETAVCWSRGRRRGRVSVAGEDARLVN